MTFLEKFFARKKTKSIVLIDIGAASLAGAYAHYVEGEAPTLLYTRRLPIEVRKGEAHERAMIRALKSLGEQLIREGAPALARASGSGRADMILVSIDAPWQETSIHSEHFDAKEPFVFTKQMVAKRLAEASATSDTQHLADESVIGTILNGYETRKPYGKRVNRASVIVLTSLIPKHTAHDIISILEELFHSGNIFPIAGSSLRYQVMQLLFPHENDAIVLDTVGNLLTTLALIRNGFLVTMEDVEAPLEHDTWLTNVTAHLNNIAKQYPLPRTIFLLAQEGQAADLQKRLASSNLSSLWLSDIPPKIVLVSKTQFTGSITLQGSSTPDIGLLFMTQYYLHRQFLPDASDNAQPLRDTPASDAILGA